MFKYSKEARRIMFRSRLKELEVENDERLGDNKLPHRQICLKCGINEAQPDTDPPRCTTCMAEAGGGNDPETQNEEG